MNLTRLKPLALATLLFFAAAASAAEIQLTSVLYPEKKSIDVPFAVTSIGPKDARISAEVKFRGGQAQIEISYRDMQPAILFSGNITAYAVWAVTKDGVTENLGELGVSDPKGSRKFASGQKDFAMMITAEPVIGTPQPSTLVVATSQAAAQKEAKSASFAFNRFASDFYQKMIKPGNPSIAGLTYTKGAESVELMRARKLVEMALEPLVVKYDQKAVPEASIFLAQAMNSAAGGGSEKVITDYAARAAARASEGIRLSVQKEYEAMKAAEEAKKAAEKAALQKGLATTSAQLDATARAKAEVEAMLARVNKEKAEVEAMLAQVNKEKAEVEADRARVKAERDALAARLGGALDNIAATRKTARGIAMDLGDVLFDVNKATLKPGARESLAKLTGVLLMLPDINVRIEGFTDPTGTAERNKVLSSERARSVFDFLKSQGIAPARMSHAGYGPANPVADNATKEGRARNRRVELTFAQGAIEPTPGGFTAPDAPPVPAKAAAKPAEPAKKN
jgi:outer membrane protein OmpA-like peptidoglycan-associated protein